MVEPGGSSSPETRRDPRPVVLVTRPTEDAGETAAAVEALGYRALCAPMLEIADVPAVLPDPNSVDAVIFSSVNGVRAFHRAGPSRRYFSRIVYAVGEKTAREARAVGFIGVRQGDAGMAALAARIRRDLSPGGEAEGPCRLLHVRGRDVREDPASLLPAEEGFRVEGLVVYRADAVGRLDAEVAAAVDRGSVSAALFFSARSGAAFRDAVLRDCEAATLDGARALCLSHSVVESVSGLKWAEICVSERPDAGSLLALLPPVPAQDLSPPPPSYVTESNAMVPPISQTDDDALGNAEAIIERFGGIRPMATKMDVPVSTVQGWRKRNVIPGNRRADVLNAARLNGIDLSGVIGGKGDFAGAVDDAAKVQILNPQNARVHEDALAAARMTAVQDAALHSVSRDTMMSELRKTQIHAVRRSVAASFALLVLVAIPAALLFVEGHHELRNDDTRISALENGTGPNGQPTIPAAFKGVITDLGTRLGNVENSMQDLKAQWQDLTGGNTDLANVLNRLDEMQKSVQGQQQVQDAASQLKAMVSGLQGRMDKMDDALAQAQKNDTALGQALEGVSPAQLKAAALLIGLSQFRDTVGRNAPFADDLSMLQSMIGDKDPELNKALAQLAPYAEKGVMSTGGLSKELKGAAGDIVVASLSGQSASIQDKMMARFEQMVSVKKDGQPVMGNPTQSTVDGAQKMLDHGDAGGAAALLQTLQGPALEKAQPIIDQAQVTAMVQKAQVMLQGEVAAQIKALAAGPAPLTVGTKLPGGIAAPAPAGGPATASDLDE